MITAPHVGPDLPRLTELREGTPVPVGGDRYTVVSAELAAAFRPGDRLVVVQDDGALLLVPAREHAAADEAVRAAHAAFGALGAVRDDQISAFYDGFATRLRDDAAFAAIAAAN